MNMRDAHNFLYKEKGNNYHPDELNLLEKYTEYKNNKEKLDSKRVAMMLISVNTNYWQYTGQVVEDIQKYFLPGHKTDIFLWSDMPHWKPEEIDKKIKEVTYSFEEIQNNPDETKKQESFFKLVDQYLNSLYLGSKIDTNQVVLGMRRIGIACDVQDVNQQGKVHLIIHNLSQETPQIVFNATIDLLKKQKNIIETCKLFEIEPIEWPYGTLMRYNLFLQQEELLKEYEYIFYMDVDMRVVNVVGDEILGEGLTMAEHPMYAIRQEYIPPYEPNKESTAYIPRFAKVISENGKLRLKPLYAAGGFQGGKSTAFIEAMKIMNKNIDKDFGNNYIAIWNDESHWNKYLFDYKGHLVALSPSYIYPDSLIEEYYKPLWGRDYPPKIITLTKSFTLQKVDGNRFKNMPKL